MINKFIRFFLNNKLVTGILLLLFIAGGLVTSPFGSKLDFLPIDRVAVDAIPDIGENQQIVFTKWEGRSPQDIDDQITYPLTSALLGIPGVKSIRSSSVFGFSSIYIIFGEEVDFYWSRSRILEKLYSLPAELLPEGVQPNLGPDATALGQVFWYTLEGRDEEGNPTGGWDLHEIRSVQDYYVKYALSGVEGVSEVASIGGYVQEYQVDVNPDALRSYGIPLQKVIMAVKNSNRDVGAKTIEINEAEYLVRGLGYIQSIEDIEKAVVTVQENVPIRIKDISVVTLGPSSRRGLLDKEGAEVVGGVLVARYGANPLEVINNVKEKIHEIANGLPNKTLRNGKVSQLTLVPFYDRTQLIYETLGTLEDALSLEVLITILVVIILVLNLRASILIASLLPVAVLIVFIAMRLFGIDANIVALSGIAIAIGTMVDLSIVLSENVLKHIKEAPENRKLKETVLMATSEIGPAIVTAVATTVISFVPVFTLEAAEGKLFRPLAFTKTFALLAALVITLAILPTLAQWVFGIKMFKPKFLRNFGSNRSGSVKNNQSSTGRFIRRTADWIITHQSTIITVFAVTYLLSNFWMPLGAGKALFLNMLFVGLILLIVLGSFSLLEKYYEHILTWCLENKKLFLAIPGLIILFAITVWLGFGKTFGIISMGFDKIGWNLRTTGTWSALSQKFPGIGKEFMPALDEGSFLLMPTSMPHAGMTQNKRVVQQLDMLIANIPEIELAVGKMGRVESALDPAPISMYENIINYKSEYIVDEKGHRIRFKTDKNNRFVLRGGDSISNEKALLEGIIPSELIPDDRGSYFRNWRDHINGPEDIWKAIIAVTSIPGVTSAPKLQPIETRLVMLQTGMRAPMGIKVYGPDLASIQNFSNQLEDLLKKVPSVKPEAVFADRIVGKPYIHLRINRDMIGRYGLDVEDVQQTIETAIGGKQITSTVEGRERFPVRIRYPRELRDDPESLMNVSIASPTGVHVPLRDLVDIQYQQGPQMIKSENTFLVSYVLFDKKQGLAEVDVVEEAQTYLASKIERGELIIPAGVSFKFSGSYENQIRAEKRLRVIIPLVLVIIFLLLYFQFRSVATSLMIFAGITMAFSGAFLMIWAYGQNWFLNFSLFDANLRDVFQLHPINLSVAVWVGFIALFGIATDDGVLIGTYLDQSIRKNKPNSIAAIRLAVTQAGLRRIKPAIMTSATTIIALLPVLSSTGRGADIMIPMAIPAFGGMMVAAITYFIVPVLYAWREEIVIRKGKKTN